GDLTGGGAEEDEGVVFQPMADGGWPIETSPLAPPLRGEGNSPSLVGKGLGVRSAVCSASCPTAKYPRSQK
ncbi:MAG: hypothetical protein ABIG63_11085, partial [Chloroflexota bacterium]